MSPESIGEPEVNADLQMQHRDPRGARAVLLVMSLMSIWACGCGNFAVRGTDGQVVWAGYTEALESAAINSAAHDLPCPRGQVRLLRSVRFGVPYSALFVLEGCGERVTYLEGREPGSDGLVYVMTGRVKIGTAPTSASLPVRTTP